jgi:deoxyribonuclease-1
MEADLHNLSPAIGEINADRSNYRFAMLPGTALQHGTCDFWVDFCQRAAEPRDAVKGILARIYFYMHDRYDLPMSDQQQRLLMVGTGNFRSLSGKKSEIGASPPAWATTIPSS